MSAAPGRLPPHPIGGDHEHVDTISSTTTIFVLVVLAVFLHAIQWVLLPFVVSGLLAYLCTPAVDWLTRRARLPRSLVAGLVFAALVALAALIVFLSVPSLGPELMAVATDFQGTVEGLARDLIGQETVTLFGRPMNATEFGEAAVAAISASIQQIGGIPLIGALALGGAFGVFLSLVLLFYFLQGGPQILQGLLWLIPPRQRPLIRRIWRRLDPVLRRYLIGIIIVVAYATAAAYVGLGLVLGLPHAVFLALLTGILEMIPMIGPAAAVAIAGLIAVRHATGIEAIIGYAIYATVLRLSIDQLFGPLALGAAARMHPVLIIFCFLSGGILFGIAGVILAVPVALVAKITLATLYDEPLGAEASSGEESR
jgi:predicted PurR-regulated permease PerM